MILEKDDFMKRNILIILTLFLLSFSLRFSVDANNFFWIDEFSTAEEAKVLLNNGKNVFIQENNYFESHNITTHFVVACFFYAFGIGEWQARLPMIFIGSFVPILIYLFVKKNYGKNSAIISSLLYIFSYWQITWARQARGYVLQQLLLLLTIYIYSSLLKKFSKLKLFYFAIILLLGLLTHITYVLVLLSVTLHFFVFNKKLTLKLISNPLLWIFAIISTYILYSIGQLNLLYLNLKNLLINHPNNLAYYHSFLWREQTIVVLLAVIGILFFILKDKKYKLITLLLLPICFYLFFVCFLFTPYVSRYLLPIFPLFIIFSGVGISKIAEAISAKHAFLFGLIITLFIIINGDKFILKPRSFYSINRDMREVAVINYDLIYELIRNKGNLDLGQTAVIDTWPDRIKWYLGDNQEYFYAFRWLKSEGLVNGLSKSTPFELNEFNEKYIPKTGNPPIKLIGELSDLEKAISKYPHGFIWIDDSTLPKDVQDYVKLNFKKELEIDSYGPELLENPYSKWPGVLYSWGFNDEK